MPIPSDCVLYFPSIEFKSDNWVKSSLLYWDKIYIIVPENYKPKDSKFVQEAESKGLIKDVVLNETDTKKTANRFLKFLDSDPISHPDRERDEKIIADLLLEFLDSASISDSDQYEYVLEGKIHNSLYPILNKVQSIYLENGRFRFPRYLAKNYMFYLATVISEDRGGLSLSTDNRGNWINSSFYTENGNLSKYMGHPEGYYSSLIINNLFPQDMSNVSIASLVKFIDEERELKERFRKKVSQFSESLSRCRDENQADRLIKKYAQEINEAKIDLKKSMNFRQNLVDARYTCLITGITLSVGVLGFLIGGVPIDPFHLYSLSSSLAIGTISAYRDFDRARMNRKQKAYASYLVDFDRRFF